MTLKFTRELVQPVPVALTPFKPCSPNCTCNRIRNSSALLAKEEQLFLIKLDRAIEEHLKKRGEAIEELWRDLWLSH